VVLHGPDGDAYTFLWDGTHAADAGEGDRAEQLLPRSFARRPLSFGANATGGAWRVTLYATPALAAQYVTSRPRDTALAVIAASLGCVLLFGCVRAQRAAGPSLGRSERMQHFTNADARIPRRVSPMPPVCTSSWCAAEPCR
jgi:hypothetical protein